MSLYNFSYQKASFRGAEFAVFDAEVLFGRRNVLHEFPLRDVPYAEDLGKKAREYTINAFVIGSNYRGARDALMAAIEKDDTPGTLVHPTLGSLLVIPKDCRVRFDNREGGIEYFTLTFVEAGNSSVPSIGSNTSYLANIAGLNGISSFTNFFSNAFNVVGLPDFLHASALNKLVGGTFSNVGGGGTDFVSTVKNLFKAGSFGSENQDFTELTNKLEIFSNKTSDNIYQPETLASNISEIITQASNVYRNQGDSDTFVESVKPNDALMQALEAMKRLKNYGSSFTEPPLTTPERAQELENQIQLVNLVINIALAQMVIITSAIDFPSRQDALTVLNDVDSYLQDQIIYFADRGEDQPYTTLVDMRTTMIKDIQTRAATLKNKLYIPLYDSMPALAFAYDQFDDASKDSEITNRNKVRNPNFIPALTQVEILV